MMIQKLYIFTILYIVPLFVCKKWAKDHSSQFYFYAQAKIRDPTSHVRRN